MKEYKLKINGNDYNVVVNDIVEQSAQVEVNGTAYSVTLEGRLKKQPAKVQAPKPAARVAAASPSPAPAAAPASAPAGGHVVTSPLPGVVLEICCKEGENVKAGQKLLVLEAMKMENVVEADQDGKVVAIKVNQGSSILEGAPLVVLG